MVNTNDKNNNNNNELIINNHDDEDVYGFEFDYGFNTKNKV